MLTLVFSSIMIVFPLQIFLQITKVSYWDFGDGITSTDENPTHKYTLNGSYTVILTAITNAACIQDTLTISITVNINTVIDELKVPNQLLYITDVLGRKTNPTYNLPLMYRYDDGTVKKMIVIE